MGQIWKQNNSSALGNHHPHHVWRHWPRLKGKEGGKGHTKEAKLWLWVRIAPEERRQATVLSCGQPCLLDEPYVTQVVASRVTAGCIHVGRMTAGWPNGSRVGPGWKHQCFASMFLQAEGSSCICSTIFLELLFRLRYWILPLTNFFLIFIFKLEWEFNKSSWKSSEETPSLQLDGGIQLPFWTLLP